MKSGVKLLLKQIIIALVLILVSCDSSFTDDSPSLPTNVSLNEIDQLGVGPIAWVAPNDLIFIFSPGANPTVVSYQIDTGNVSVIETPDISIFPTVGFSSDGKVAGYTNNSDGITIVDVKSGNKVYEGPGTDVLFSSDGEKTAIWEYENLYVIEFNNTKRLIYQIDPELFWDELHRPVQTIWRPGTDQIAILMIDEKNNDFDHLLLVEADTTHTNSLIDVNDILSFAWSPNGQYIAYSYRSTDSGSILEVMSIQKNCSIFKIKKPLEIFPLWSPNGQSIFLYKTPKEVEIMILDDVIGNSLSNQPCTDG